jgi:CAAX protease family protein
MNPPESNLEQRRPLFPAWTILGFLLVLMIFCSLLGNGIILGISYLKGIELQALLNDFEGESTAALRNFMRMVLLINHVTTFLIPALILVFLFYRKGWASFLKIKATPKLHNLVLAVFLILAAFPLAQLAVQATRRLLEKTTILDWAGDLGSSMERMIQLFLTMPSPWELFFSILVMAVVPAIGEELVFRGIVQQNLEKAFRKPHLAIWLTAFIFALAHFQMELLFGIFLLGALLGYLFYWTGNLWVPIMGHFINNAFQVMGVYFYADKFVGTDLETEPQLPLGIIIISIIFVLTLGFYLKKLNRLQNQGELGPFED